MYARLLIVCAVINATVNQCAAHPGATDSKGGHYNRKTGGYHTHGGGGDWGASVSSLLGLGRSSAPTTARTEARAEPPTPRTNTARTHLTDKLGSKSAVRTIDERQDEPAAAQIIAEQNSKDEIKSRGLLNYANRQYTAGNIEIGMRYVRRVLKEFPNSSAAIEAEKLLQEWKDSEPFREWADATGKYKTIAKFVRLESGSVYLMNEAEKIVAVDMQKLNRTDQLYVIHREGI